MFLTLQEDANLTAAAIELGYGFRAETFGGKRVDDCH
jgi:hypothetical protein